MEDNFSKSAVLVDIKNSTWPLVISFAGLGDEFQFRNTLAAFHVNVIYLRDLKHNWYLNGIPGAGANVEEIVSFLKDQISTCSPPKVITMGASAGGFASILYGTLLNANQIVAFSPQTFMNKFYRFLYFDRRWRDRRKQIYSGDVGNRKFLNLEPFVKSYRGSIQIFYDGTHRLDRVHATRLNFPQVKLLSFNKGGHALARSLKDDGQLNELIENILC
jgi:hypothetical protein